MYSARSGGSGEEGSSLGGTSGHGGEGVRGEVLGLEIPLAYVLLALTALVLGLILGLRGRPELSSYMVVGGILAYLITSIVYHRARWIPLMLTLGLHIGAVLSYYSNPIVLPMVVIERWGERSAINLDIVQLIIAYELVTTSIPRIKQNFKNPGARKQEDGAAVV
jgi:hypothetical protein